MRIPSEQARSLGMVNCFQILETGRLLSHLAVNASICTDVVCAVGHDLGLFRADFHSIRPLLSTSLLVRS